MYFRGFIPSLISGWSDHRTLYYNNRMCRLGRDLLTREVTGLYGNHNPIA
jgi:hypothetical protein